MENIGIICFWIFILICVFWKFFFKAILVFVPKKVLIEGDVVYLKKEKVPIPSFNPTAGALMLNYNAIVVDICNATIFSYSIRLRYLDGTNHSINVPLTLYRKIRRRMNSMRDTKNLHIILSGEKFLGELNSLALVN